MKSAPSRQVSAIGSINFQSRCIVGVIAAAVLAACGGSDAHADGPPTQQEVVVTGCNGTVTYAEAEGAFANGSPWSMRRPTGWNGLLINDLDYVPAKDGARSCYWLQRGYALSGTGRNPQRNFNGCVATRSSGTMGHGPTASSTDKLELARGDQAASLSAGGHAGVRSLVCGLPAELAQPRRNDGRARRHRRPCHCPSLGAEDPACPGFCVSNPQRPSG